MSTFDFYININFLLKSNTLKITSLKRQSKKIKEKEGSLVCDMTSQDTIPRQLTDLIGSLYDLTCESIDKGTPVILVQSYFIN